MYRFSDKSDSVFYAEFKKYYIFYCIVISQFYRDTSLICSGIVMPGNELHV